MKRTKKSVTKKVHIAIALLFFLVLFVSIGLYGALVRLPAAETASNEKFMAGISALNPLHATFNDSKSTCGWKQRGGLYSKPICTVQSTGTTRSTYQEVENFLLTKKWQLLARQKRDIIEPNLSRGLFVKDDVCADVRQQSKLSMTSVTVGTGTYCNQLRATAKFPSFD